MEKRGDTVKEVLELYMQKRDLIVQMANDSQLASFSGAEGDIEQYINAVEAREKIIDRLKAIMLKLEDYKGHLENPGIIRHLSPITEEIKINTQLVIDEEKKNKPFIDKAYGRLKKEIKGLKSAKSFKSLYQSDASGMNSHIDARK